MLMTNANTLEKLGFDKIEIVRKKTTSGPLSEPCITLCKSSSTYQLRFSKALKELSHLAKGDRVDLYCMGSTFALKPCDAGCLNIVKQGSNKYSQLVINSINAYLEIKSRLKDKEKTKFEAWVENGIIFFR